MNIPIGVIVSMIFGFVGLCSALVTVGVYIGGLSSKYVSRIDFQSCKKSCLALNADIDKNFSRKLEIVSDKHDKMVNDLFAKMNDIFKQMEELKLDIMKIQTTILANEKSR